MQLTRLGKTELQVSPIAFGTWQLGGDWGTFDEREAVAAIRHARARGINLFDTAQAYGFGRSERLLGHALRDDLDHRRDEVVIATKGGLRIDERDGLVRDSSPAWLRHGVDESLRALGVDHIDLYQVHWPDPDTPTAETAAALEQLVQEGKIRHVGVSNFSVEQIAEFGRTRPVEAVQPPYHLFRREIETDLLPYTRGEDIGVLAYGTLAHGLLTGTMTADTTFAADDWRSASPLFEGEQFRDNLRAVADLQRFAREHATSVSGLAIAWALSQPAVDVAIVGSRRTAHIDDALTALDTDLSGEDLVEIDRIMTGAVPVGGPSPDAMP